MIDFKGARGSNTGDDFHELWATRQAIRLLSNEDGLEAITVEGVGFRDEAGLPSDTWDGVDCTQYFGGQDATAADHVQIEQLKYSAANPNKPWTIARLVAGQRGKSVIARLAKAWKGLTTPDSSSMPVRATLISNQPVDKDVVSAVKRAGASSLAIPKRKPKATAPPESRLAYAAGLNADDFRAFASALHIKASTGSRFALEEQVLRAIAAWTDQDVQGVVTGLRQFIRRLMMPESAGETITRESILLQFGVSVELALFPCPPEITAINAPVSRAPVRDVVEMLRSGNQYLCLHGRAGVGKTTALQEIEEALPPRSIMVKYDCYGGGRYLDPSALRHRSQDAFVQLTNELAVRLRLPLLLSPHRGSDFPRLFASRLKHAAKALAAQHPDALVVVAVDAADNAVTAAQERSPVEESFVHDFVQLTEQPENVRFIVTARSGRRDQLQLPRSYCSKEIEPFSPQETNENVARVWPDAPSSWIEDFHHSSSGVPRVQDYAFKLDGAHPRTALDRLRPHGKLLEEIFEQQFLQALTKSGSRDEMARLCAALIVLPRPVPLSDLAAVLDSTDSQLIDVCTDLAPGIRLQDGTVTFADEDFEAFVRSEGETELALARTRAADRLLSRAAHDRYAALHVASALVAANRGEDLLRLVEAEPVPAEVSDPVLRKEAELQRLRLAIKVCREAGNVEHALRFVLIGAEGIKTETAVRRLLLENPDLAARFAPETARRLILSDADLVKDHGPFLFHKLAVDADRGDAVSYREGLRFLSAWLQARGHDLQEQDDRYLEAWKISVSDISSSVEAALKLNGVADSLRTLQAWTPRSAALEVGLTLPYRLIAEGCSEDVEAILTGEHLEPLPSLFLLVPLALAGRPVDIQQMSRGLEQLVRRKLKVKRFFDSFHSSQHAASCHAQVLETALTACEILTIERAAPKLVDGILADFLDPELRRIEKLHAHQTQKLDFLFRAYALREAQAGRMPDAEAVFEPRPSPPDERSRQQQNQAAEEHDRPLRDLTGVAFEIYATVANALVKRPDDADLERDLRQAVGTTEGEKWRISREYHSAALCRRAATSLLVLLAAGHAPEMVKRFAVDAHGNWRNGNVVPDDRFVARMGLWPCLHASLLDDLAAAAAETRTTRSGADERSSALVSYARLMTPLSKDDANEIFNHAVEVASELDREAVAQVRLLDELVDRGNGHFTNARSTARRLSNIVADAAIRLEGYDDFPWERAMAALARLDAPLALANTARWDDEGVASRRENIGTVLVTGMREGTIRPEQAAALSMLADDGGAVMAEILKQFGHEERPNFPALVEEAAFEILMRHGYRAHQAVACWIEEFGPVGPWSESLLRQDQFLVTLAPEATTDEEYDSEPDTKANDLLSAHVWTKEALLDSSRLQETMQGITDRIKADRRHYIRSSMFESARNAVSPADRVAHIRALAELDGTAGTVDALEEMFQAVDQWSNSPSVRAWCERELPELIVARFPALIRYLPFADDHLTPALNRTGLDDVETQNLLLKGLERHAEYMKAEQIFALAGMTGRKLARPEAASLADWYAERLENRVPAAHRDQTAPDSDLPRSVDEAAARFLFAYMGDCDLRLRWRSAHAIRRLARTGVDATLMALIEECHRRKELVFRSRDCEFYWLAARLWFVVAWDRVTGERPEVAAHAGAALRDIALDESFPHLLVRSFARDACEKLTATGHLSLTAEESHRMASVDESVLPRAPADQDVKKTIGRFGHWHGFAYDDKCRRFNFDTTDTLPYWYAPMLKSFAAVDGERFLCEAERWIIDEWGFAGDIRGFERERRRSRFNDRNWSLSMHNHGSTPTLEPLKTHLEWHAMWCASGELLKTEPLVICDEHNWDDLSARIHQKKLMEPPLWSADLLVATPLLARNWQADRRPLDDWVVEVQEADLRAEIFPCDRPRYVVVDGSSERSSGDRIERVQLSSSLVEPETGRSLVRALQTMGDSWDYKLPDEQEELAEIDNAPYRFLGWLQTTSRDESFDSKDPFRGHALKINSRPGQRAAVACNLKRDRTGHPCWYNDEAAHPMFVYEAWGVDADDEKRFRGGFEAAGSRLVAHKEQLLNFLRAQALNLIIEVEVERRDRESRRYFGAEEDANREGRFARLYLLCANGDLEVAEGRIGTWTGDRPTA